MASISFLLQSTKKPASIYVRVRDSISKLLEKVLEGYFAPQVTEKEEAIVAKVEEATPQEKSTKPSLWAWVLSLGFISFLTILLVKFSKKKEF